MNNHLSWLDVISLLDIYKSRTTLVLALFLIGQSFATAHAIEFGVEPHQHNGVVCLTILSDEQDGLAPPSHLVSLTLVLDELGSLSVPSQVLLPNNPAIKPPSTGPPSL